MISQHDTKQKVKAMSVTPQAKHTAFRAIGASALLMGTLAACGSPSLNNRDAGHNLDRAEGQIAQQSAILNGIQDTGRPSNVNVNQGIFLGDRGFRSGRGAPLPSRFETPDGITLISPTPMNIEEFSQRVEELTGIRVDYDDLFAPRRGGREAPVAAQSDSGSFGAGQAVAARTTQVGVSDPGSVVFTIRHSGRLSALLDQVASRMNADWAFEGGRILFRGPQTVTYTLWALPQDLTTSANIGGGGAFGSSSPPATSSSIALNYWESIESGIEAILPATEANWSINRNSGTITVTANQAFHARVQNFIENENRRMSRQVAIRIDVVAFSQTRNDNINTSLGASLANILGGLDVSFGAGTILGQTGGTNVEAQVVSGSLAGTRGAVDALSRAGRASLLTSHSAIAMNNVPTPVTITNERGFVSGATTSEETGTQIETQIVSSGISFVVTPRILSSGQIMLNYNMTISELENIETINFDGGLVQLPEISTQNFLQNVNIASGDSMIISSFNQNRSRQQTTGPFDPRFWGFGGNRGFDIENTRVMIIMTPTVVEESNAPRARRR